MPLSYRWACGNYHNFVDWFREIEPAMVMVANDHSTVYRALTLAAKSLGIPTVFLQHASTGKEPAPLHYDLAFLDSEADLERYQERERWMPGKCRAFVVGNPQHDPYLQARKVGPPVRTIGLCVRDEAELKTAADLSGVALEEGWRAIIRPHPSFALQAASLIQGIAGLLLSDSKTESTLCFLEQVTCVVSGLSSIIRDAVIAGRTALLYEPFRRAAGDWYGYEESKLCSFLSGKEAFRTYLASPSAFAPPVGTVRRFHAPFDTPWEGRSAEIVAGVINRFLQGNLPSEGGAFQSAPFWGKEGRLEIYRLAGNREGN